MNGTALQKGQRVITPEGPGEVIEITGDEILVKLDSGQTKTFPSAEVEDDSSAG
jgi:preprotein translocase subunit YajC